MQIMVKTALLGALVVAGHVAQAQTAGSCEGVVSIAGVTTSARARADGTFAYTVYIQNRQPRRIQVTLFMGNFPADVTLTSQVIQNLILTANFGTGFRLGTGRNKTINNTTVDLIYSGTSGKPYIRLQDCRPY